MADTVVLSQIPGAFPSDIGQSLQDGLRIEHGRGMTSLSKAYLLPADKRERDRLSLQHHLWRLLLGGTGLYPPYVGDAVDRLLARPIDGQRQPAVLDVGSGSGIWAVEMAELFPHVRVLGLDLAKSKPPRIPINCSFVAGDAMNGLEEYTEQFDIVHCRCVKGHVTNSEVLLNGLRKALRPGGLLLISDGLFGLYDQNRKPFLPEPVSSRTEPVPFRAADNAHSWLLRWQVETLSRMGTRGDPFNTSFAALTDAVRQTNGFNESTLKEREYYCPVGWSGAWESEEGYDELTGMEMGEITRTNLVEWVPSSIFPLLSDGIPRPVVDSWMENTLAELANPERKAYITWGFVAAIRGDS